MDYEVKNPSEICRTCLTKTTSTLNIFSTTNDGINIAKSLSIITSIKITNDGKSSIICEDCYNQLKQAIEFRNKCRLSYKSIQQKPRQTYQCSTCGKCFTHSACHNIHGRIHRGDRPYKCPICHRPFRQRCHLIEHERSHGGILNYRCSVCTKAFVRYDVWRVHERSHTIVAKKHECHTCGKMFFAKKSMVRHKKKHGVEFNCKDCDKSFLSIVKHVENEHSDLKVPIIDNSADINWIEPELNTTSVLNCNIINTPQLVSNIKVISCAVCQKVFKSTSSLRKHQFIHANNKPYCCIFCEKTFTQSAHLKHHIRTHTGEKPYGCTVCLKQFTSNSQLTVHMRTHSGERPFNCSVCGKGCTTSTMLKVHIRTHTGETPYKCDRCPKTFSRSDVLALHKNNKEHS